MANDLTPEDCLHWKRRAPWASYLLGVSDSHPFIDGARLVETTIAPPPPYTQAFPTLPTPLFQPYFNNNQQIMGASGTIIQRPSTNPVPTYDAHNNNSTGPASVDNDPRPPAPRKFPFGLVYSVPIDDALY